MAILYKSRSHNRMVLHYVHRLQADMAYFGQKLGPFDPNGIIGTRLMKQVKELDLSDKKRGAGTSASAPSASTGAS